MKQVSVTFPTGGDVLNAYWGFLAHGGLILDEQPHLEEGDAVALRVHIESSQQYYELSGHVVRGTKGRPDVADRTIIAFEPGQPHELMLSAAWAETDNVPPRKFPRLAVDVQVRLRYSIGADEICEGRLLNISLGGCCLRLGGKFRDLQVASSKQVTVIDGEFEGHGAVRWARASLLGIEFDDGQGDTIGPYMDHLAS